MDGRECWMHNNKDRECATYFKSREEYRRCFGELWKKWRSYGRAAGKITLHGASEEERRAVGGITGKIYYGEEVRFSVSEFEAGLQKTRFAPIELKALLEEYFGKPLCTRQEQKETKEKEKNDFWQETAAVLFEKTGQESAAVRWFEAAFSQKKYGYQILNREYAEDPQQTKQLVCHIAKAFTRLEAGRNMDELEVPLAVFAADISGNPHYFDRGTLPGQLLTQAVCWLEQAELPENSYEWRERMEQAGILPDNVSSSLHAFGLLLYLGQQAHPAYEAFCRLRQPFVITMENLRGVTGAEPLGERIYIVENEMVFSYLVTHLIKSGEEKQGEQKNTGEKILPYTLLCTSGQPRAAAQKLLPLLLKSGASIYYSGDIDPDGMRIADRLWQKFGDGIQIWRMSPEDYQKSISAEHITENGLAKLEQLHHPLLRGTARCVKEEQMAGYQENLLEELLGDMEGRHFLHIVSDKFN